MYQTTIKSYLKKWRFTKMKKILALVLVLAMVACLFVGCATTDKNETTKSTTAATTAATEATETTAAKVDIKVALVTDVGTIDDESFNQATWQGVKEFCEDNSIDYTYYQPTEDSTDARVAMISTAVAEGYNVIVMPGYLFGAAVVTCQDTYPDVYFIAIDVGSGDLTLDYTTYSDPAANTVCITFEEDQAGYLAGYAAVMDGYTQLGFLGGMAVPAVIRYGYGFVQGCDAAASELGNTDKVSIKYTYGGQFFGDASITAKMDGWYAAGTEVVFACGGGIYTSAVEAANNNKGKVIGVDVDQHYIDPCIITAERSRPFPTGQCEIPRTPHGRIGNPPLQNGAWMGMSIVGRGLAPAAISHIDHNCAARPEAGNAHGNL
jgi:basic membrane protein A